MKNYRNLDEQNELKVRDLFGAVFGFRKNMYIQRIAQSGMGVEFIYLDSVHCLVTCTVIPL